MFVCPPPIRLIRQQLSQFEIPNKKHLPTSNKDLARMNACLNEVAHSFVNTPISSNEFFWRKIISQPNFCSVNQMFVTKSDKGAGYYTHPFINHSDYISKMLYILDDVSKFDKLGNITQDNSLKTEIKMLKFP